MRLIACGARVGKQSETLSLCIISCHARTNTHSLTCTSPVMMNCSYRELMVVVDTCQGGTLHERLYSPNILMGGSSSRGENSWSHGSNGFLGTTMMDRFTHSTLSFFERRVFGANKAVPSLADLLACYDPSVIDSHPSWNNRLKRPLKSIAVTEFFGFPNATVALARTSSVQWSDVAATYDADALRARFSFRANSASSVGAKATRQRTASTPQWYVALACTGVLSLLLLLAVSR